MRISLLLLACLASLPAKSFAYNDPDNLLQKLDEYLGDPDFDSAFKEGNKFTAKNTSCVGSVNKCDSGVLRIEVKRNGADEAFLNFYSGENTNPGSKSVIKRSDWAALHGSFVRGEIAMAESLGQTVTIDSLVPAQANIKVNGVLKTIQAMEIQFSVSNITGKNSVLKFKINRDLPGIGQRAYREANTRFIGTNKDTSELLSFTD
jgi:hypothetical protein